METDVRKKVTDWFRYFAPVFIAFSAAVGLITRIILLFVPPTVVDFTATEWLKIFLLGLVNDVTFSIVALAPAALIAAALNDAKYRKPYSVIITTLLAAFAVYALLPSNIFTEYGSVVPSVAIGLSLLLLGCWCLKLFLPGIRRNWRKCFLLFMMGLYVFLMVLNAISECVFWNEFGVRYNFIAVDYLVYTNEVIGNIMESYPIVPLFLGVLAVALLISWRLFRGKDVSEASNGGAASYLVTLAIYAAVFAGSVASLRFCYRNLQSANNYATELQCNGCWNFLEAYSSSTLEYDRFYQMLPQEEAQAGKLALCGQTCSEDGSEVKAVRDSVPAVRKNIVLVVVESLSADFLSAYGNTDGLTPNLDTLMEKSLVFDNLYAAGNRSVRGLEALTLCLPPSAGESVIKRPGNAGLFSTGSVLRANGYTTSFIYGGDSYFDNMQTYFQGNGFEIIDKASYPKEDIIFSNIWGTCDEDSYRVALDDFDRKAATGKPFHSIIFTISNHRPYTYPEGRITYDGEMKSRSAAVKYTDYSIGQFLAEASRKPWFGNTVFVIVADHCASSAGKTSIPVDKYHIPAIIYSPGFIEPGRVGKLCSQIDLMPTVFSLLHFSYDSKFYGQDILSPDYNERAFMATYQDLGYYSDGILTVLSPVRRVQQFDVEQTAPWTHSETPVDLSGSGSADSSDVTKAGPAAAKDSLAKSLVKEAQVFYQSVNLRPVPAE
jgi:phosphoglycerol transferase MdoB-like AlkP superfamily enzyme